MRGEQVTLRRAIGEQVRLVSERAEHKAEIEALLEQRTVYYSEIRGEIAALEAIERAQSEALGIEAQERLARTGTSTTSTSSLGTAVAQRSLEYLGIPYLWGGATPAGFDCSGLVVYVYQQLGIQLPHYTVSLWNLGEPVTSNELQPGDLVFFHQLAHMGIYLGNGQFVQAPRTGDVVKVSSLQEPRYASSYDGARRIHG